jgi:hypothetical protein
MKRTLMQILQTRLVRAVPRILALLDKNPLSPTTGSFDRKYWHYKIIDFPCGMQQELILPLAYIWQEEFAGNLYYHVERLRHYVSAAINYHVRCCHPDGSMDDYFPFERAYGATAYGLAAVTEASILTDLGSPAAVDAMEQSGSFLASYREAGVIANHLAIASLALLNVHILTGREIWKEASDRLVDELAALQHPEGWFREYEGCDLGYQTVTIEFLARRYAKSPSAKVLKLLEDNVTFVRRFLHPDGSFGGEYGSRNTYNFYPGGFALLSTKLPDAAWVLGGYLKGLESGTESHLEDDGVFSHLLSSYVTVLSCEHVELEEWQQITQVEKPELVYLEGAGLFVGKTGRLSVYGATSKGGLCKVFRDNELVWSDTGLAGRLNNGTVFCQNKPGIAESRVNGQAIEVKGRLQKFSSQRLGFAQMIVLRVAALTLGRWRSYSNFIRRAMQKVLIYNQRPLELAFRRVIQLHEDNIVIEDDLDVGEGLQVEILYRTSDCVNTHAITSDSFQKVNLLAWEPLETPPLSRQLHFTKEIGR